MIELDRIQKIYRTGGSEVHAVRGVSLSIQRGEFVAFMGSSGSGKSTMMNILGCLDRPTGGRYLLAGDDVSKLNRDARALVRSHKLGFVFQGFNLLPRATALENVELPMLYGQRNLPRDEVRARALKSLEQVGLKGRAEHYPSQLSGGQQQRVAIARAVVNRPALLLADEPTGNLDSRTSLEIMAIFQRLNAQGDTIVMVTHEPDVAAFTGRQIYMKDGRVLRDEPTARPLDAAHELQAWQGDVALASAARVTP